jgi:hypothetical protein
MHVHRLNEACSKACTPGFQTNLIGEGVGHVEEITATASHKDFISSFDSSSSIVMKTPWKSFDYQTRGSRSSQELDITTPFVRICAKSRTNQLRTVRSSEVQETSETDLTCVVYPKAGGKFLGMSHGMLLSARSTSGWQFSIQPFRAIPENSLVFEFCRKGNLDGVRTLFQHGEASPWDRYPAGRTPLWVRQS